MMIFFNAQDDPESPPLVEGPFTMTSPPCNMEPPQGQQQSSPITSCLSPVWLQTSCCQLQEQQPTKETILNDDSNNHWKLFCLQRQLLDFLSPNGMLYIKGLRMMAEVDSRDIALHIRNRHWCPGHKFQTMHLPIDYTLLQKEAHVF
jgi:hypothetical protein